jgi:hypothetical protein
MSFGKVGLSVLIVAASAAWLMSVAVADVIQPSVDCAACHEAEYEEWEGSPHAGSQQNPFYLAMLERYKQDTGDSKGEYCQQCHAPAMDLAEEPNESLISEGINCSVCHSIKDVTSTINITPFVLGDGKTQYSSERPGKKADSSAHPVELNRVHQRGTYCSGCHNQQHVDDSEFIIMNTWNEWKSIARFSSNFIYCNQCHMEAKRDRLDDPRSALGGVELRFKEPEPDDFTISHMLTSGTDADKMKGATRLKLGASSLYNDISFHVELQALNAGHMLPTGFYLNDLYYTIEAVDQNGVVLFDDEQHYRKVLGDADDNPVWYDWQATKTLEDTRIPADGRIIRNNYAMQYRKPYGTVTITAKLFYAKMPQELATELGLDYEPDLLHEREWSYTP